VAGCNDRDEVAANGGARAALSAECTDPELIVESQNVNLWPPNHKFHDVTVDECVSAVSTCDGELTGEFIWASSDEPIDDIGDGHHFPDIGLGVDTGHVCVRSERQGPKDGRVYKLGVRITDASGESVERECVVAVVHDKRGVPAFDSGESYRIEFDASQAGLDCEGNPPTDEPPGGAGSGGGEAGSGGGEAGEGGGDPCTDPDGCVGGPGGEAGEGGGEAGEGGGEAGEGGGEAGEGGGEAGEGGGEAGEGGGEAGEGGGEAGEGGGEPGENGGNPIPGGGPI
jgi:hypothetical protein